MGRCSSKAFGVAWNSPRGLFNHTLLPAETNLGLGSALNAVSSLGRTGSPAVMVLVQASSDEILSLRGCASPWEQGLGSGLMSGCC